MITVFSDSREFAPVCQRLWDEGIKTDLFISLPRYRTAFNGIIPKISLSQLKSSLQKNDIVIFDMTKPNDHKPDCIELLRYFGIPNNRRGVFGSIAEKLKKDKLVIGAAEAVDVIEFDRAAGASLAEKFGFNIPPTYSFSSLRDGTKFLQSSEVQDKLFVLKLDNNKDLSLTYVSKWPGELLKKFTGELPARLGTDKCDFILQEVVEGCELSTEAWSNGRELVSWNHTLEDKRFLSCYSTALPRGRKLGVNTGSQSNTVWMKTSTNMFLEKEMSRLGQWLNGTGYLGPFDVNCIVDKDGKAWFLEFTPRFGYSALYVLLSLIPQGGIGNFLIHGFEFIPTAGFAASQVVSIPPYPAADQKELGKIKGTVIDNGFKEKVMNSFWMQDVYWEDGGLHCAGADGFVGVMTGTGNTVEEAVKSVYGNIDKLRIGADLQYRVDHLESHSKRLSRLYRWGVNIG